MALPDINTFSLAVPTYSTAGEIVTDQNLSPFSKAKAIGILQASNNSTDGLVTWPSIARAAAGAGVGYIAATLFGKTVGAIFGGLSQPSMRRLKTLGVVAGMLKGTGAI